MPLESKEALAGNGAGLGGRVLAEGWGWRHTGRKAWALEDLSFQIEPGERVLLAGASGSGKSTLLHALAGVLEPEEGESTGSLTIGGHAATDRALRGDSGLVQQDPGSQIVMERIGDEVAFGLENIAVPEDEIWERVQGALEMAGLDLPLDHRTDELSGGQKQRLALACALAMRPQLLLLDEPTANLDPEGAKELREQTKKVVEQTGATLIVVEHNLEPWLDQVDRMIVLSNGKIVADGPLDQVLAEHGKELQADGVWVPGEDVPDLIQLTGPQFPVRAGEEILSSKDLAVGYPGQRTPVNQGLNYRFDQGSVSNIVGPNGAGKSTFALTMAGLLEPVSGHVIAGADLRDDDLPADPNDWESDQLLGRVAMVFQEPAYQFLTSSVREELELGLRLKDPQGNHAAEVDRYLEMLHLKHLAAANPFTLSGGEKRRLSVATAMINKPKVLLLDEPTFGQDRNTWISLVTLLKQLAAGGTTLICTTHDDLFVEVMGGRLHRMEAGGDPTEKQADLLPSEPPISRVNPFVALVGLFILTIPLILTIDQVSAGVALALELLMIPLLGLQPRQVFKRIWPLLLATPFAVISMLLYGAPGGAIFWQLGPAIISENSVQLATAIGLRILAVGIPAILILSTIDSTRMADALIQIAHLPAKFVLSALAGMRMVSLMLSDWKALARARRSRGATGGGRLAAFFKGSLSLLTFAIRRAGTLSTTMEARGFGTSMPRTRARQSRLSQADAVMLLVSVLVPAVSIASAVATGSFRWFGL